MKILKSIIIIMLLAIIFTDAKAGPVEYKVIEVPPSVVVTDAKISMVEAPEAKVSCEQSKSESKPSLFQRIDRGLTTAYDKTTTAIIRIFSTGETK